MTCVAMEPERLHLYIQYLFRQVDNLFVADGLANHLASKFWLSQDVHQKLRQTCQNIPAHANLCQPKYLQVMVNVDCYLEHIPLTELFDF
jgi:hypothetical protein